MHDLATRGDLVKWELRSSNGTAARLSPLLLIGLWLTACGGDGSSAAPTYSVGGSVSGLLSGTSVVLANNGTNSTAVSANTSFIFSTPLRGGESYAVAVTAQPVGETCGVVNAAGVVGSADVSVAVTCTPNSYSIGGTLAGLSPGTTIVLANASGGTTSASANGTFEFGTKIASGGSYDISVSSNPLGETCAVTNATGTIVAGNITNIAVTCSANAYTISANVFGLLSNSNLVLQDNGGDDLTVTTGGVIAFQHSLASQAAYTVTVSTQPSAQSCFVTGGTGKVAASNVTVTVVCPWHVMYIPDSQDNAVLGYYIDPTSGSLLSLASNALGAPAGLSSPVTLVATPNAAFLYVANQGSNSVAGYAIDPLTGALTPVAGSPFPVASSPRNVVIDSTGHYLYTANMGIVQTNGSADPAKPSSLSAYAISPSTGVLTPVTGSPFLTVSSPSPVVADPAGNFLFAATGSYAIDPASGALTFNGSASAMGCANTMIGAQFCAAAVMSTGNYLYVGSDAFAIDGITGVFTAVPSNTNTPMSSSVAVAPNNRYLYFDSGGYIGTDAIDPATGLASPIAGSPYLPADLPATPTTAYAIDPSGAFLYITTTSDAGIFGFALDESTGKPTPLSASPFTALKNPGVFGAGGYSIGIVTLH